jgi:flagellar hook assembly protein FlgD
MDLVRKIPNDGFQAKWDGRNEAGNIVASGVYSFRAEINGKVTWGKIVVIN